MKLFALATAVSANSFKRTDHPAPGIINEQGGYWADGQYNPVDGQAPQISFQKKPCCEHLRWYPYKTDPGVEIWLHYQGEHRQMPYYKGEKDGETVYAWMNYQGSDDYWLGNVKTAHWIISKKLGDYEGSSPENETISDYIGLGWEQKGYVSLPRCINESSIWHNRFVCSHPEWGNKGLPEEPKKPWKYQSNGDETKNFSCENIKAKDNYDNNPNRPRYGIFSQHMNSNINTCNFYGLMNEFGTQQMARAVAFIDSPMQWKLKNLFQSMIEKWAILSGQQASGFEFKTYFDCGFNPNTEKFTKSLSRDRDEYARDPISCKSKPEEGQCPMGSGFIDRCDWMCKLMEKIDTYKQGSDEENAVHVVKMMIDRLLWITDEIFTRNHSQPAGKDADGEPLPWEIKGCQRKQYNDIRGSRVENIDGKPCQPTDYCGQRIREMYELAREFEEVLSKGPIDRIYHYNQSWKYDKIFS